MGKKSKRVRGGAGRQHKRGAQEVEQPTRQLHQHRNRNDEVARLLPAAPPSQPATFAEFARLLLTAPPSQPATFAEWDPEAGPRVWVNRLPEILSALPTWDPRRLEIFMAYAHFLAGSGKHSQTHEDFQLLKKIGRSKTEPTLLRVTGLRFAGIVLALQRDTQGKALRFFDDAISTISACLSAADGEKERIERNYLFEEPTTVGALLEKERQYAKHNIDELSVQSFAACIPDGKGGKHHFEVPSLVGLQCEGCGKKRKDSVLFDCEACKMACYCSRSCQKRAWNEHGHKLCCRKKGDFRVGDLVSVVDGCGQDFRFGDLFRIKRPAAAVAADSPNNPPARPLHWVVELDQLLKENYGSKGGVVAAKRLKRVRSGLWNICGEADFVEFLQKMGREHAELPNLVIRNEEDE